MTTYFKSFTQEQQVPMLRTYDPTTSRYYCSQTLPEIINSQTITPNTVHSQLPKRLCVSHLTQEYQGTYRSQGLFFQTAQPLSYAAPFDLMTLTTGKSFTSSDYLDQFISGHEQFRVESLEQLFQQFPNSSLAIEALNLFREQHGVTPIDPNRLRYNECCFEQDIKITPVALVGPSEIYRPLAIHYNLPHYETPQDRPIFF